MMEPIQVLLADDHTLIRAGIRSLLVQMEGVEVVGEASNGREALQKIRTFKPDVALIDIAMPELNGLETIAQLTRDYPEVRTIILSVYTTEEYVLKALQVGASGYLVKDAAPAELEIAVKSVAGGETYLSPSVSKHVITEYLQRTGGSTVKGGKEQDMAYPLEILTPRQREVLQLIAEGNTTKKIARKLNLSVKTVETHRQQLMERLDIHDIAGLVRYAIRGGLVIPDQ